MQVRYEEATGEEYALLSRLIESNFPELVNAKFRLFFDMKKHISQGRLVLAQIYMSDDLTRYLTIDERADEGADYCIFLDFRCWSVITMENKTRIMRHELRHTRVETESKRPYKLAPHDIEDFVAEVKLNSDDPGWRNGVVTIVETMYEQEEAQKK
jgi:hypothetical protein